MAFDLSELLWPVLVAPPLDPNAVARDRAVAANLAAPKWTAAEAPIVLAEAQRIVDAEADRRRSADNKAAIYLAAIAAILPLLASTETIFWDDNIGKAPAWVSVWPMLATIIYVGTAGFWAVRVLRVSATIRVDVEDLSALKAKTAVKAIAKEHLKAVYASRGTTNDKISRLKMTHEFLLRAAVAFAILLVTETAWSGAVSLAQSIPTNRPPQTGALTKLGAPRSAPPPGKVVQPSVSSSETEKVPVERSPTPAPTRGNHQPTTPAPPPPLTAATAGQRVPKQTGSAPPTKAGGAVEAMHR